jgi:hypothetical protein
MLCVITQSVGGGIKDKDPGPPCIACMHAHAHNEGETLINTNSQAHNHGGRRHCGK